MEETPEQLREEVRRLRDKERALEASLLEIYTLYNVTKALSVPFKLDDLFDTMMQTLQHSLHVTDYCLLLLDEETETLGVSASLGFGEDSLEAAPFSGKAGLLAEIMRGGRPHYIADAASVAGFDPYNSARRDIRTFYAVPLLGVSGRVFGLLNFHSRKAEVFPEPDRNLLAAVGEHVGIAIDKARRYQQTLELSNRDPLLGVYNRRYFFDAIDAELTRSFRYNHPLSVVMIDIDHFKLFNDRHGHLKGDVALRQLSSLLQQNLRRSDVLARYGGEEFIMYLPETDRAATIAVADKLRKIVAQQHYAGLEGDDGRLTITLGVSALSESTATSFDLVEYADKALYYGKALGRNRVCADLPAGQESPAD